MDSYVMRRGGNGGIRPNSTNGMTKSDAPHVLHVCTTCRHPTTATNAARDGAALFDAIRAVAAGKPSRPGFLLNGVECMSGCNRPCTIGLSAPGKMSYLFGDLTVDGETASQALELATLYQASETGIVVRAERPSLFRAGILARVPAPALKND